MLKIQEIREMIKLIDQSSIHEFSFEQDGAKIKMKKQSPEVETIIKQAPTVTLEQPVQSQQVAQQTDSNQVQAVSEATNQPVSTEAKTDTENLHKITSPMVGTFYAASSPETEDFVSVGSKVTKESVVCIVEAMKLFNEIEAEVKGEIVEILVQNGQLVEYGQPLFLVKPE
ncbi:acetyl-CoA carboxylase biotin carboxyl carrier protein [Bacillus weihaiensis]|uniref:Biotin carboxyl carrier protein of acetyl-CoA carboxylase n=1 Tax=Bacillus weihaiensis TaxID=1547283 RepID=A0A1L3MQ74_9BACI|nr:acetyl-CoA carboxylase biotin carboxyl carrier protein [Bacillus weihaiensis]APH04452.1 acetyl-CoA carboxylase, biotin carboxyl carrier protein [Bacillus weihaiensis]